MHEQLPNCAYASDTFKTMIDRGILLHQPHSTGPSTHIFHFTSDLTAVPVPYPAQFRQKNTAVPLVELDLFRVGVTEIVGQAFLPEARKVRPLGEEIAIGPFQVLERLLQGVNRRIGQPGCFRAVAPVGEHLAQPCVAELFLAQLVAIFL